MDKQRHITRVLAVIVMILVVSLAGCRKSEPELQQPTTAEKNPSTEKDARFPPQTIISELIYQVEFQKTKDSYHWETVESRSGKLVIPSCYDWYIVPRDLNDTTKAKYAADLSRLGLDRVGLPAFFAGNEISCFFVSALTNLTSLHLNLSDDINDLLSLSNMINLVELELSGCEISDLSPLANLTNLTSLDLGGCQNISDLLPLSNLINLKELSLTGCGHSDLSSLSKLTKMTILDLGNNTISDLSFLENLTNLTKIDLRSNPIVDLSSLANLTELSSLNLMYCDKICDLAPISNLTNLTELYLTWSYRNLSDLSPLEKLVNLTHLDLGGCYTVPD